MEFIAPFWGTVIAYLKDEKTLDRLGFRGLGLRAHTHEGFLVQGYGPPAYEGDALLMGEEQ